jgi:hypothetical protein
MTEMQSNLSKIKPELRTLPYAGMLTLWSDAHVPLRNLSTTP